MTRDQYMQLILMERERQFDLPGREFDVGNAPNDWVAIITSYVVESITRNHIKQEATYFEECLIKAAAVILATLEHIDTMKQKAHFQ